MVATLIIIKGQSYFAMSANRLFWFCGWVLFSSSCFFHHFYSSSFFHFIDFSFQCFQFLDGSLSLFMFAFQFVINVFNSMLLMCFSVWLFCDYFNYYFLIFCWCFLWCVFKLSTLCFCFLDFIFGISTFNILCSIFQIFLFSSIFNLKMFPLFSLQTLLDFLFLFLPNVMAMMMIILRFVLCCVFSILCQIVFVCILFCTIRLLEVQDVLNVYFECDGNMWWTLNFKVMTTCELYVTF
jgi:hypothetical protein